MAYKILGDDRVQSEGSTMLSKDAKSTPFDFTRHALGEKDILIEIPYAGICHSDIHTARNEWGEATHPCVPGHEIAGEVVAVGKGVSQFKVGDYAGVSCMVNPCGEREAYKQSQEQFCKRGQTIFTYNNKDIFHDGENTHGGYSNNIVVSENFAIKVPKNASLEKVAPLLCARITTYSPLKFSKVKEGFKVGVAGFGGLGVMAVKYVLKMGASVSVFARSERKKGGALKMGVSGFYVSARADEVKERFDLIISTIPTLCDVSVYLDLLKSGGEFAIVEFPPHDTMPSLSIEDLVYKAGKKVYDLLMGGTKGTQEMMDFSLRYAIHPETELIKPYQIDEAYEKLINGTTKSRYAIDTRELSQP